MAKWKEVAMRRTSGGSKCAGVGASRGEVMVSQIEAGARVAVLRIAMHVAKIQEARGIWIFKDVGATANGRWREERRFLEKRCDEYVLPFWKNGLGGLRKVVMQENRGVGRDCG
jgi:hypothetical protein